MLTHHPLKFIIFLVLLCLIVILFMLDILAGPVAIPLKEILHSLFSVDTSNPVWRTIISDFRIPKALTALLAGAALSVSGLQMQTVFRNPLAGPYVLGISSGASLGVALVVLGFSPLFVLGGINPLSVWVQIVAAWIGAAAVMVLIMAVSLRVRDIMTILILGVLFGSAAHKRSAGRPGGYSNSRLAFGYYFGENAERLVDGRIVCEKYGTEPAFFPCDYFHIHQHSHGQCYRLLRTHRFYWYCSSSSYPDDL
jgi:hypothetical protein